MGEATTHCRHCDTENPADANFCNRCGTRLGVHDTAESTVTFVPPENEVVAEAARPEQVLPVAVLLVRAGGGREGETVELDADLLTIGRNPENHLFLDDVTVSRHHARIVRDAAGFSVEDLNSLNGTYVNRRRVERQHLHDGDELQIGKFKLVFLEATT